MLARPSDGKVAALCLGLPDASSAASLGKLMPILATDEEAKNDRYWCRTGDEPTGPCFGSERYSSNGPVARLRRPHAGSPKLAAGGAPCAGAVIGAVVNIEGVGRQSDEKHRPDEKHRRLTAPDSW